MIQYSIRNARASFADVIGAAQYGGETVEITKHGKPVARVVPVDEPTSGAPELEADLAAAVDAYADSAGLDRDAAIAALLRAGLAASATTTGIADLFPEVAGLDGEAAHEVILGDQAELGESVEYDYDGDQAEYGYAKTRGRWVYTVSHPTSTYDSLGLREWTHRYEICRDKRDAQARYRDAIVAAGKHWTEGTDSMWFDAVGPTFDALRHDRAIPLGSFAAADDD